MRSLQRSGLCYFGNVVQLNKKFSAMLRTQHFDQIKSD
ncbi:hypothetical protein Enr13x_30790 [Stieleria neptunia]|uniref:Uncharacterized protein n=1 Tax=Stieleria neptunia TaxID=2527979 RepID=A0A518HQU7_9BACT|nr:hypothetical protein Enr13x_30790 [Stieleria neptunia]